MLTYLQIADLIREELGQPDNRPSDIMKFVERSVERDTSGTYETTEVGSDSRTAVKQEVCRPRRK